MVNGPFVLGYPVAFEPSGFVSVVVVPVVERVRMVFQHGHVTSLVRAGGIVRRGVGEGLGEDGKGMGGVGENGEGMGGMYVGRWWW